MAQTNVNIRMDSNLKKEFSAFCDDMGLTMTAAFNIFAKKAVREYRIPFEIGAEIPNNETIAAMEETEAMLKTGKGKRFNSVDELFEDLNK